MWDKDSYGLTRFYKERAREAKQFESIKLLTDVYEDEGLSLGDVLTIETDKGTYVRSESGSSIFLDETDYVVLESTDIIMLENTEYSEKSKVEEGDLIVVIRNNERKELRSGQTLLVKRVNGECVQAENEAGEVVIIWYGEYIAIEPYHKKGSINQRILDRFDETEKAILAGDISLEDAFDLISRYRYVKEKSTEG
jgi:co-chaperonin GroES (HSP10)